MRLEECEDVATLQHAARILQEEIQKLVRLNAKLQKELIALKGGEPEQLTLRIAALEEQLAKTNKKLYGEKTERRSREKVEAEDKAPQTGHGPREQPALPVVEQVHVLDEADKVCTGCGGSLTEWDGQFEESEEIDVIERRFVIKKHKRKKYRCQCGQCIETAPGPTKLFDRARYSPNFAITVAVNKYADHLPLERQVKVMNREGLIIDSQTLWDQLNALARLLEPCHGALQEHVLGQPVIGADETHWRLMGAKGKRKGGNAKRWQVWATASSDAVCYRIQDSRSTEAARNVLCDYDGTVLCDGYSAYQALQKQGGHFRLAHCWAHVRRKFVEIEEFFPEQCAQVLDLIGKLYEVERNCPTGPPGDELRARLRAEHSKPIVKQIQKWALTTEALPQSSLGKAISYMGDIWNGLQAFLDDPRIAIDNNGTERALRGVVVGRKNHYGSRSRRGTEVAALFYSLIESAKLVGVGPNTYLKTAVDAALRAQPIPLPHQLA